MDPTHGCLQTWADHKPAQAKRANSLGFFVHCVRVCEECCLGSHRSKRDGASVRLRLLPWQKSWFPWTFPGTRWSRRPKDSTPCKGWKSPSRRWSRWYPKLYGTRNMMWGSSLHTLLLKIQNKSSRLIDHLQLNDCFCLIVVVVTRYVPLFGTCFPG